ncbi:MAG TPA: phage tail protein [Mycobacterium sp.]|nr:phage tail protein [Mycobacterium sp.]
MVWSGNHLEPGDFINPFDPGPGGETDMGNDNTNPITDHYSFDAIFTLGIPPAAYGAGSPNVSLISVWYGDARVSLTFGPAVGTYYGGEWSHPDMSGAGHPFLGDLMISLRRDFFSVAGKFYPAASDGVFPLDGTDMQPINVQFKDGIVLPLPQGGEYPDRVYYSYNGSHGNVSPLTAIVQSGDLLSTPGMRNQVATYLHAGLGQSSSVSGFSFEILAQTASTAADLGTGWPSNTGADPLAFECDPAAVLVDILTSPWGKVGFSSSQLDMASFRAASATLKSERLGYSRFFDQVSDAGTIINELLRFMDAVLYQEPTNGLLTLKLVRFDYDVTQLMDLNPDNAMPSGSSWYSVQGWSEIPNQMLLTYTNRNLEYRDSIIPAQDAAALAASGQRVKTTSVQFPGACTDTIARVICSREFAAVSKPMVKATLVVNRGGYQLRPGSVVTLTWPELNINKMIMRVAGVDLGQLNEAGITVQLMRDFFDVKVGAY